MKQRTVKLSSCERNELIEHRNHDPRPDVRERCAAVLKVADGQSPHAVAQQGLLRPRDPDTVYGWLDRYEQEGIDGLLSGRQGGSRPHPFPRTRASLGTAPARPW
jgi:winged helix-turn helix protein